MFLAIFLLFFVNINLSFDLVQFYIILFVLFFFNKFLNKNMQNSKIHSFNFYLSYSYNKFLIKSFTNFLLSLPKYRYLNVFFNSFFKWSPIFKRTSYFGLYNFSKNK